MHNASREDLGKFILRASLAILILLHGLAKISNGVGGIEGMLTGRGLPGAIAYLVYVGEVLAPVMLLLGFWTRLGAFIIAINMVVAVWLVHMGELFQLTKTGGWALELQGMYFFSALAVMLLGAGSFSIGGRQGRWN